MCKEIKELEAENKRLKEALERMKCYGEYCDSFGMSIGGFSLGNEIKQALESKVK